MPSCTPTLPQSIPQDAYNRQTQPPAPYGAPSAITTLASYLTTSINEGFLNPLPLPKRLFLPLLFTKSDGSLPIADFPGAVGNDLAYYNIYIGPILAFFSTPSRGGNYLTPADLLFYKNLWLATVGTILVDNTAANRTAPVIALALANFSKIFNGLANGTGVPANKYLYNPDGSWFTTPAGFKGVGTGGYAGLYYLLELN